MSKSRELYHSPQIVAMSQKREVYHSPQTAAIYGPKVGLATTRKAPLGKQLSCVEDILDLIERDKLLLGVSGCETNPMIVTDGELAEEFEESETQSHSIRESSPTHYPNPVRIRNRLEEDICSSEHIQMIINPSKQALIERAMVNLLINEDTSESENRTPSPDQITNPGNGAGMSAGVGSTGVGGEMKLTQMRSCATTKMPGHLPRLYGGSKKSGLDCTAGLDSRTINTTIGQGTSEDQATEVNQVPLNDTSKESDTSKRAASKRYLDIAHINLEAGMEDDVPLRETYESFEDGKKAHLVTVTPQNYVSYANPPIGCFKNLDDTSSEDDRNGNRQVHQGQASGQQGSSVSPNKNILSPFITLTLRQTSHLNHETPNSSSCDDREKISATNGTKSSSHTKPFQATTTATASGTKRTSPTSEKSATGSSSGKGANAVTSSAATSAAGRASPKKPVSPKKSSPTNANTGAISASMRSGTPTSGTKPGSSASPKFKSSPKSKTRTTSSSAGGKSPSNSGMKRTNADNLSGASHLSSPLPDGQMERFTSDRVVGQRLDQQQSEQDVPMDRASEPGRIFPLVSEDLNGKRGNENGNYPGGDIKIVTKSSTKDSLDGVISAPEFTNFTNHTSKLTRSVDDAEMTNSLSQTDESNFSTGQQGGHRLNSGEKPGSGENLQSSCNTNLQPTSSHPSTQSSKKQKGYDALFGTSHKPSRIPGAIRQKEARYMHENIVSEFMNTDLKGCVKNLIKPYVIGVCGATCSGKTTLCNIFRRELKNYMRVAFLPADSFYKDLTQEQKELARQQMYDFDHPDAIAWDELLHCLKTLKQGFRPVEIPKYDFVTHSRIKKQGEIKKQNDEDAAGAGKESSPSAGTSVAAGNLRTDSSESMKKSVGMSMKTDSVNSNLTDSSTNSSSENKSSIKGNILDGSGDKSENTTVCGTTAVNASGLKPSKPSKNDFTKGGTSGGETIKPADVIIVEGILVYAVGPELRNEMDLRIFIDCDSDIRLARRLQRDIAERGRDFSGTLTQYMKFVKPSYENFIEPSKRYADVIIPNTKTAEMEQNNAIHMMVQHIKHQLEKRNSARRLTRGLN